MALTDITSANAIVMIQADEIIPQPVRLENFSVDAIAQTGAYKVAEARKGIDGNMAAGYVPSPVELNLNLEANTPSERLLYRLMDAQVRNEHPYNTTITIRIPAQRSTYTYIDGVLAEGIAMNNLGTLQEKSSWKFQFKDVSRQDD